MLGNAFPLQSAMDNGTIEREVWDYKFYVYVHVFMCACLCVFSSSSNCSSGGGVSYVLQIEIRQGQI